MIELCEQAGSNVAGVGILIEKSFQMGRKLLEEMGMTVYSLARIGAFENGQISFIEADL